MNGNRADSRAAVAALMSSHSTSEASMVASSRVSPSDSGLRQVLALRRPLVVRGLTAKRQPSFTL